MQKYKYVLLDWDGNLARTLDLWLDAFKTVLEKRGIMVSDEEIAGSFGAFVGFMRSHGLADPEAAWAEADQIAQAALPEVELYPDALFVLNELHSAGKKLALITTSPHKNVAHLLEKHAIRQLFDVIVAGDDVTHHKPHSEPLEMALTALAGVKDQAVMIGDSDKDLGAAQNFGIDSILFYPAEHHKFYNLASLEVYKPTHVIADFKDILQTI